MRPLSLGDLKISLQKVNPQAINALVVILVIVLYLGLFLGSKIKQISYLLPQVSQLKAKITNTEKDWANIDAFKKKISQLNEKIDYYEKRLPSEKEVPVVLEYLSSSARKLNVRITEIEPVEQSGDKADKSLIYYNVPILLRAECGYHQLGRFLNELERADRFMKISDIEIETDLYRGNPLYVELTIVTYVMGQR